MRNFRSLALFLFVVVSAFLVGCGSSNQERTVVILSTNDIHSQIDRFPALATAIKECRDTAEVILVDAGDRCTGNAFVDLVEHYKPLYELMDEVGYDLAIYGNHEFDKGQANASKVNENISFKILGANAISDTSTFAQPEPYQIIERNGLKIGFVGVVSNFSNGHPVGKDECYVGVSFKNPYEVAAQYASIKEKYNCDLLVLVTHIGSSSDLEFAKTDLAKGYDLVISSHDHKEVNELVGDVRVVETGSRLHNLGVTTIKQKGDQKPEISYYNQPLEDYKSEPKVAKMVEGYFQNPELTKKVGELANDFSYLSVRNLFAASLLEATGADLSFYHSGGVRLNKISKGDLPKSTILDMEPFGTKIVVLEMTAEQMKNMIMARYRGKGTNIDLYSTTPYTVAVDTDTQMVDVLFPELKSGKKYKVAINDYIYSTYKAVEYSDVKETGELVTTALEDYLTKHSPLKPDNTKRNVVEID